MAKPSLANVSLSLSLSLSVSSWFFLRQFSSTPSRLIPDAGTEKLAGVLLISGKTRQVPSRRVTVGGRGSKGLFSPSISLPLFSFVLHPAVSLELLPCRRFNNFDLWFWFYLRKPPNTSSKLVLVVFFLFLAFRRNLSVLTIYHKGYAAIIISFLL